MKILAVGGGSGGHVTPVVAVLREIKKIHPEAQIRFWCDNKFAPQARSMIMNFDNSIPVKTIMAGKFRRYNHLSFWEQITWPSLVFQNLRDSFFVFFGFLQSIIKLLFWRPDVVFTKGGYVCLPVGLAAKILNIPLVIHDSDAHPGLTNRVLSKWAKSIATGAPLDCYDYPASKSKYVGIPINEEFRVFTDKEQIEAKRKWGIDETKPLIVITGGGLGATRINDTVISCLGDLLKFASVILVSGVGQYDQLRSIAPPNSNRFQLHAFISKDMASLLGAADIVIARAGATTILELAALAKSTILIPNAKLTGGHQIKNAEVYTKARAVLVVDEDQMLKDTDLLISAVETIFSDPKSAAEMRERFASFSRPDAAKDVAKMILAQVKSSL